jgi:hypothetical protein
MQAMPGAVKLLAKAGREAGKAAAKTVWQSAHIAAVSRPEINRQFLVQYNEFSFLSVN